MAGRSGGAQSRPGWVLEADLDPVDEQLRRRRWRILRAVLPIGQGLDPLPTWVKTPEQFVGWLIGRLSPAGLRTYFEDLEEIAKQTCDLELLRLARRYQGQR
ncbi:MAG: hypothetical protein KGI92_07465 [Alphaproteobacteria bacterium]|nr:hypothetical protein [Alphaproteobacteria bacterium]MDE1968732.1 hypothetical protein [Alphaproteobacteria bacterium]